MPVTSWTFPKKTGKMGKVEKEKHNNPQIIPQKMAIFA